MNHLDELENRSIFIIREAYNQFKNIAFMWSVGKDSTVLLWLVRKAFFGKIPFPMMHIDTSFKFPEMIKFRDEKSKEWNINLIIAQNKQALEQGMSPENKLECCNALKTTALKNAIQEHKFKALLLGIRRDEHGIRAKERYFSPRDKKFEWNYKDQPAELWDQFKTKQNEEQHIRVHPLLHWTELDIWEYIKREKIPIIDMYFAKKNKDGKSYRYRSIGCQPCCKPIESNASNVDEVIEEIKKSKDGERSGRSQDKEDTYTMQKLRSLGYM